MRNMPLKILSYNIHKGFASGMGRFVLPRIKEILEIVDADIVFLQEVLGYHSGHAETVQDWPSESQMEYLADSLWPHRAYGKNAVYTAGHHGNAILSKYQIKEWENIDVSTNSLERRGMLHGVLEIPEQEKPLHVICMHLDLLESGRIKQVHQLSERISSEVPADSPLIVAGDFNDWRARAGKPLENDLNMQEAHRELHGNYARTFPSIFPMLRLDRIYCRHLDILHAECLQGKPWNELSDHSALFAKVALGMQMQAG